MTLGNDAEKRGAVTLQEAINSFYAKAVTEGASTSTKRLDVLADYCVHELAKRGLKGVEKEAKLYGGGRTKQWDVAWSLHGKYRLAISLKSILKNLAGTVPNRIDDLMGEVTNVQLYSPEIVTGYMMIFDASSDVISNRREAGWLGHLRNRLEQLSGRKAPAWSMGMIEASCLIEVDFSEGPFLCTPEVEVGPFFDRLVGEVKHRNPILLGS
jgi:hypothetical protein